MIPPIMTLNHLRTPLTIPTMLLNSQLHHNRPPIGALGMLNDVFWGAGGRAGCGVTWGGGWIGPVWLLGVEIGEGRNGPVVVLGVDTGAGFGIVTFGAG